VRVLLLCAMALALAPEAHGAPETSSRALPQRRVAVLPARDFRVNPDNLFVDDPTAPLRDDAEPLVQAAETALAAEPEVAVIAHDQCAALADKSAQRGIVARGFLHLGTELYRNIRLKDAIAALEKGVEAAMAEFLDVCEPKTVSDLYLYLGLSYLELHPRMERPCLQRQLGKGLQTAQQVQSSSRNNWKGMPCALRIFLRFKYK